MSMAEEIRPGAHAYRLASDAVIDLYRALRRSGDASTRMVILRLTEDDGSEFEVGLVAAKLAHGERITVSPRVIQAPQNDSSGL